MTELPEYSFQLGLAVVSAAVTAFESMLPCDLEQFENLAAVYIIC